MPKEHARVTQVPLSEVKFVRRVLIVAGVAALTAMLWMLSDILLLVFASVLLAVILRTVASFFSAHTGFKEASSLLIAGMLIVGLAVAAILLFGAQLRAPFNFVVAQLQSIQQTIVSYFDTSSFRNLRHGRSLALTFRTGGMPLFIHWRLSRAATTGHRSLC